MSQGTITGTEQIKSPLQKSGLHKKGLCDYVINVASGCLHGCTFCYVPSTPAIRARQEHLQDKGVENPQYDWGKYLFVRDESAQQLEEVLASKRTWPETPAGKGVVMLCSGTDPYQNNRTAAITRACVEVLLKYGRRVRILTRSPLWTQDLDILVNPLVTVGMSLPHLDDRLSCQIEPNAPLPSSRYQALKKGATAGCRLFVAMAPTPPNMKLPEFHKHLSKLMEINPEVIFWEPINPRGSNKTRMLNADIEFASTLFDPSTWGDNFIRQWRDIEAAASSIGCQKLLHIWPDLALKGQLSSAWLEYWWSKPTIEQWPPRPDSPHSPQETPRNKIKDSEYSFSKLDISFGHTCDRLLSSNKTVTRREWEPRHVAKFIKAYENQQLVRALSKDWRYKGQQVGWLKLTRAPYKKTLSQITQADCAAEGYPELTPFEFHQRFFKGLANDTEVWVIEFQFIPSHAIAELTVPSYQTTSNQEALQPATLATPDRPCCAGSEPGPMKLTAIALFSGLGLVEVGLKQTGFDVVGAVEKQPDIAEWHQLNHPNCKTLVGSVDEFDYRQFAGIDLLHFSPPCQQYSVARSSHLARHEGADVGLLAIKAIQQTLPRFVTLENVKGYLGANSYHQIKQSLWNLGYWLDERVLNSYNYGVPQSRVRLFSLWIRRTALPEVPVAWTEETLFGEKYWSGFFPERSTSKGWYNAIEDLLPSLEEATLTDWYLQALPEKIHSSLLFSNRSAIPRTSDLPAFTVTCSKARPLALLTCDKEQKIVRLSTQCLARFQTVPDSFKLPDTLSLALTGIGNGVPCEMMRQVASTFLPPYREQPPSQMEKPQMTISLNGTISIEDRIQELTEKARSLRAEAKKYEEEAQGLAKRLKDEILQTAENLSMQIRKLLFRANQISPDCVHQIRGEINAAFEQVDSKKTDRSNPIQSDGEPPDPVQELAQESAESWSTDDWRTPNEDNQPIVDLVLKALGGAIGLDPTADTEKRIPAQKHFTKADNCLEQESWASRAATVFMNPPYSNPKPFLEKLFEQMDRGHVNEAIALLPVRCLSNQGTGPIIFERAAAHCTWNTGRIAFIGENGTPKKGANFDCCLIYFGSQPERFAAVFKSRGNISFSNLEPSDQSPESAAPEQLADRIPPEQPHSATASVTASTQAQSVLQPEPPQSEPQAVPDPTNDEQSNCERLYYPEEGPRSKARYCANFNFNNPDEVEFPEVLTMWLYNRSKTRLEKICRWAVAEGFAKSGSLIEKGSPDKTLTMGKIEARLILSHPEALRIITDLDPKADPPKTSPTLGKNGELFFVGDRVQMEGESTQHIISCLKPPTEKNEWTLFLTNPKTGEIRAHHYTSSKFKLIEAAPDFANAYKPEPYTGLKVGDKVLLQDVFIDKFFQYEHSLSYWLKLVETDPSIEFRIAAFLDDGKVALYQTRQNGTPNSANAIVPPTALILPGEKVALSKKDNILEPPVTEEQLPPDRKSVVTFDIAFDFPDIDEAKTWELWFSLVSNIRLNPHALVSRAPRSKRVELKNLTEFEKELLYHLELTQFPPSHREAGKMWEEAEAKASEVINQQN